MGTRGKLEIHDRMREREICTEGSAFPQFPAATLRKKKNPEEIVNPKGRRLPERSEKRAPLLIL